MGWLKKLVSTISKFCTEKAKKAAKWFCFDQDCFRCIGGVLQIYALIISAVFVSCLVGYFLSFYFLVAVTLGWLGVVFYVALTEGKKDRDIDVLIHFFFIGPLLNSIMWVAYYFATGQTWIGSVGSFLKNYFLR